MSQQVSNFTKYVPVCNKPWCPSGYLGQFWCRWPRNLQQPTAFPNCFLVLCLFCSSSCKLCWIGCSFLDDGTTHCVELPPCGSGYCCKVTGFFLSKTSDFLSCAVGSSITSVIQIHWIWIRVKNFGPICVRIQGYINFDLKLFFNYKKIMSLEVIFECLWIVNLCLKSYTFSLNLSYTYLSGSGSTMVLNTDPNPQHWFILTFAT